MRSAAVSSALGPLRSCAGHFPRLAGAPQQPHTSQTGSHCPGRQGMSNDEIAGELVLSVLSVRTHIQRALTKLGARDRAHLVVIAYQTGLVRPESPRF